jgi:ribosomal protein L11 methyltransferase
MTEIANEQRAWKSVQFETGPGQEDLACWLMIEWGAGGCEVQVGEDQRLIIKAAFDSERLPETAMKELALALEGYGLAESLRSLRVEDVDHQDYLSKWKEGFGPFLVGERLQIVPVWKEDSTKTIKGRVPLILNPGMAFGTGLHATTQYCLQAIERLHAPERILDIGTGSGILAIACVLLHPKAEVVAVDKDANAIANANENIELNALDGLIEVIEGEPSAVSGQFDAVLSNLTCEDIISLLPKYLELLASGGKLICAGVLAEKLGMLEDALKVTSLRVVDQAVSGEWVGLTLQK